MRQSVIRLRYLPPSQLPQGPFVLMSDKYGIVEEGYESREAARKDLQRYRGRFPKMKLWAAPISEAMPPPVWAVIQIQGGKARTIAIHFDRKKAEEECRHWNKSEGGCHVLRWAYGVSPDTF